MSQNPALAMALALALPLVNCAHGAPQGAPATAPAPAPLTAGEVVQIRAAMQAARAPASQIAATVRTTRFGSDGRTRLNLQVVLARPDRLRVTVLSPHGPPLWAMACDGAQITALDVGAQAYSRKPATPQGLAHYLAGLDLDLDAAAWVALFLGEMDVPEDAVGSTQADGGRNAWVWRWRAGQKDTVAVFDAATGQLLRANLTLGDGREGTLKVQGRNSVTRLPQTVLVHVGPGQQKRGREPAMDIELVLADVQVLAAPIGDEAFVIAAPGVPVL